MDVAENSVTVLLVEDEPIVLDVARRALDMAGFDVLLAMDGRQAIDVFRQNADQIDVVLLDLSLPALPGERVLNEILHIDQDARVIVTSGHGEDEARTRLGAQAGDVEYIRKPYTPRSLIDRISHATISSFLDRA